MGVRAQQSVNATTPAPVHLLTQTVEIFRTDTTAFNAFVLPEGAVIAGCTVMGRTASDAATTATISLGTNPGTTNEILAAFDVKTNGQGEYVAGSAGGTSMGIKVTAVKLIKAVYAETGTASTTGGPWLVKVSYYYPQPGYNW